MNFCIHPNQCSMPPEDCSISWWVIGDTLELVLCVQLVFES